MKNLLFRRTHILRAIQAACVALFLMAATRAQPQTATPVGNGNVSIQGSGTNYEYQGTNPTLASGGTLTIQSGSTITNNGNLTNIINLAQPATIINDGTLTITNSGSVQVDAINDYELTGTLSVTNAAGATASATSTSTGSGFGIRAGAGQVTVTNNGTVSNSGVYGAGMEGYAYAAGGSATVTNTGSVSGPTALAAQSEDGTALITNSGTVTSSEYGIALIANANGVNVHTGTVINSGKVTALSTAGSSSGIYGVNSLGNLTITNNGAAVSATATASGYYADGIEALSYGSGNIVVANNGGKVTAVGNDIGFGIYAEADGGNVAITNSGAVSGSALTNSVSGIYGNTSTGAGSVTITNTGSASGTSPGTGSVSGIYAYAAGNIVVTNSGSATASGDGASLGIEALVATTGNITVTNTGSVSASTTGTGTASGIYASTGSNAQNGAGNITISSSGNVSAVSPGTAYGIVAAAAAGNILVTNTATASATTSAVNSDAYGIYASTNGNITINNKGTAQGMGNNGSGSGIYVVGAGTTVINNSGTAIGSDFGLYVVGAATVNDSGTVSGGVDSITVPTGSTVNLSGSSPLHGLISGGADASSTSQLNFDLTIRSNYTAAKAALDAAIASYDTRYAAAMGVGSVESSVVVLNGFDYQWENFLGISDNLIQGRLFADTPGFHSLGSVLDNLDPNNPQAAKILTALGNVSDAGLPGALAELSPKSLEVFRNVAFDNNTFNDSQINNHLANLRDGLTGFDSSALTIDDPSMDPSLSQVKSHLLAYNPASTPGLVSDTADAVMGGTDMKEMKSPEVNTMPTDRWSSFIAGDVILANLSSNSNLQNADYTTGSVTGGVDYRLDQHFTVGALLAYAHTDVDLDRRGSSATVDSYTPGIYGSYVDGGWYANGLGTYVRNAYTDDRNVDIAGISGDNHGATSGNQGTANLTGGYEFHQGSFKFGPVASLQYVHLAIQSIQEEGPASLNINDQNQDSLRSLIGFEGRFVTNVNTPIGMLSLTPHLSASWQHEYLDDSDGITSQFNGAGGGSFSVQTDNPDRDSAFIDAGLDATLNKNVTIFVDYETQAGQDNFFAQSAQGGVKIGF
jgi:outer membrane autotransporter protein